MALTRRKKILFTAWLTAALPLGAELVVRLAKPRTDLWALTGRTLGPDVKAGWADVDAFCAYRARPGRYAGWGSDERQVKTVNSDGYISTPEVPLVKSPGTFRVAFLGESSCAGTGSDPVLADQETWPWLVVENLRERFPGTKFDFLNAAGSGFTTFESLGRLWARVRFYRPDVVVIYHGWNDLGLLHPDQVREGYHRWRVQEDGNWALQSVHAWIDPLPVDHLIRPSQLLTKLRVRLSSKNGLREDSRRQAPDCDLAGLAVSRENLRLMLAVAMTCGAEAFVCKQATLIVPGLPPVERDRCAFFSFPYEAHLKAYGAWWEMVDQEVPADRRIDITSINGRADLFLDHVHPNPAGSREVARLVAEALAPWVRDRPRPN